MNNVQSFIDRQLGNYNWQNYDTAIRKLRCKVGDDHTHISTDNSDESGEAPVFACKFAQTAGNEHILALANEEGQIAIHNTEHNVNGETDCYGKTAHYNAIFDLAWMMGQMKLVSVSGDHTARLFDVSRSDIIEERIFHGHTRSVKTVAFRKDDPAVFATGARDGAIFVWDTRANYNLSYITQPDRIISNSHNIPNTPGSGSKFKKRLVPLVTNVSGANSVTGLVFQNDMSLISCGAGDGAIKVWDLRKNYGVNKREPLPKCVLPYTGHTTRNGFTNLLVDRSGVKLYANCMDNTIYCYNISTYQPQPIMTYTGHYNSSFYVKSSLSVDGNYLLSGSSDQNAYIWNTNKSTPLVSLVGHSAEVTCVAWCQKGGIKLVTCSDDMKHKIWQVYDEQSCDDWEVKGRGSAETYVDYHTAQSEKTVTYL
ncbi:lethal-(2)-denticleless [Carabus blaptoides fortunei]